MKSPHDYRALARQFQIYGEFLHAEPYGSGHINDTYCAVFDQGGAPVRYILQRINHNIFKDPVALMENIQRVTAHLSGKLAGEPDFSRRVLTLVPTRDGRSLPVTARQLLARLSVHRKGAHLRCRGVAQAGFEAAKAFGQFQKLLADLPAPRLHDTIPDFHHTPKRFAALEKAIAADVVDRARLARPEIEFALKPQADDQRAARCSNCPERVTHNDTKFNNVMLDDATGEGICVIDLDTVMPGLALYDFGDMVRTTTSPAKEDERDLSKVHDGVPDVRGVGARLSRVGG